MNYSQPRFNGKCIELSLENDIIRIDATAAGLKKIIEFCEVLLNKSKPDHIHLEDYEVLTEESLIGVIALWENVEINNTFHASSLSRPFTPILILTMILILIMIVLYIFDIWR